MLVSQDQRLWTLNTPRVPEGINDARVRKHMLDEYGIEILGGFGPLAGKIFRIGLMGSSSTEENVDLCIHALVNALKAEGSGALPSTATGRF